ncbi:dihydroorotate dehydrogenase electron transfer subunit [Veillonella agrestimuris]|uniref:dihydroorotate dehydrogenase electron transfer subunit n=1 Tax=Veillonella agrestimuris TaxID=2941340 RepID=UPI00203BC7DE|nr:dihydroorotate dehydrogenase electron transfer subunit [Veillonella agrestimuris]
MSGYVEMGKVIRNVQIGSDVWLIDVYALKQAAEAKVGQFCNVRVTNNSAPLLRRPISYAGFDAEKGTITLLYRVVGAGTELMTHLVAGDTLDCLGPLGEPFQTTPNMLLVGGGVGIAPMLCIASHLQEGEAAQVILGFRNESETFWADLFKDTSVKVHITTDDGSVGTQGFPTAIMPALLQENDFTSVMTCGPTPMMKGVATVAQEHGVPCQVSLEERMGCGTGGCLGCSCDGANNKRYKVCTDGPVFPAEEVFF